MRKRLCFYCCEPVTEPFEKVGKSRAHPHCFAQANPLRPAGSVYEMIRGDDPLRAAEVLQELVPPKLAGRLVREFNLRRTQEWLHRCQPEPQA